MILWHVLGFCSMWLKVGLEVSLPRELVRSRWTPGDDATVLLVNHYRLLNIQVVYNPVA